MHRNSKPAIDIAGGTIGINFNGPAKSNMDSAANFNTNGSAPFTDSHQYEATDSHTTLGHGYARPDAHSHP